MDIDNIKKVELLEDETIDDLQYKNLRFIQSNKAFKFGTDGVLLSSFANIKYGDTVVDYCSGSGIIPILVWARSNAKKIIGLEIQEYLFNIAKRNAALNGLSEKIEFLNIDIKDAPQILGQGKIDCILCNPPYGKVGASLQSDNDYIRFARHEILCTLEDCIKSASKVLKYGGRVSFVHQAERIDEIILLFNKYDIAAKRIQLIQASIDRPPNLILIEGVRGGKNSVKWLAPIILYDEKGNFTKRIRDIYHENK